MITIRLAVFKRTITGARKGEQPTETVPKRDGVAKLHRDLIDAGKPLVIGV